MVKKYAPCLNPSCGYRAAWTLRIGRRSHCPRCECALPPPASRPRTLAVLGTAGSGKTSWLVRAVEALTADSGEALRVLPAERSVGWDRLRRGLATGRRCAPTPDWEDAWCLDLPGGRRLIALDTCGRVLEDRRQLTRQRILIHVDSLALVVDPFGLAALRKTLGGRVTRTKPSIAPSRVALDERHVLPMIHTLESFRSRQENSRLPLPLAVVITKLDAFGLGRRFEAGVSGSDDESDAACRSALETWGLGNLMRSLGHRFDDLRYFASDRSSDRLSPARALRWLLDR